jgi:hypothetical protein
MTRARNLRTIEHYLLRPLIRFDIRNYAVNIRSIYLLIAMSVLFWATPRMILADPIPRPEFTQELHSLRPTILQAAHRHNVRDISKMSDEDFAVVITLILYNEDLGSLEEKVKPLRSITGIRREAEIAVNEAFGTNLSIRPSNIRPSVAYEMLQNQLPVPMPRKTINVPVFIVGSTIKDRTYTSQASMYAAITEELAQPNKAVEYLAANLERGIYRSQYEHVPVEWKTLMAWHIRGIVSPHDIQRNPDAYNYTRRTTYLEYACKLIYTTDYIRVSRVCRYYDAAHNSESYVVVRHGYAE